jgi:colanic acid/amylovoran biosynthesis glycosyltransferase
MRPAQRQTTCNGSARPSVVIFRRELLHYSETFIVNQARALQRYSPFLIGTRRADLPLSQLGVDATTMLPAQFAKVSELGLLHGVTPPRFHRLLRRADLVHAHFGPDAALLVPSLSRARFRATPLLATFHGFDATGTDDALRALGRVAGHFVGARPALFRRANSIIAVSEFVRTRLVAAGADPRKVIVHYIGIDTGFFWAPTRSAPPPPSVLFLGRLHEKKGAADLLRALARLETQGLPVACTVAGSGAEESTMRRLAHDLRLDVRFVGPVDAHRARDLLHATRVLCVPSMTASTGDAEGFGLVFAEAQACGVPVVSYRSGGVPEAVVDNETGLLATERDIEGLSARLHNLLTNDETWLRMSTCGRRRTVAKFDLAQQTAALERIYDESRGSAGR